VSIKETNESESLEKCRNSYADGKKGYAYQYAIELLGRIGSLMKRQKRRDEFLAYVKNLPEKHRYQHSFANLLDRLLERHSRKRNVNFRSPS